MDSSIELHDALAMLATHGEPCTFMPVSGGGERSITAALDEDGDYRETPMIGSVAERLTVFCLRDEEHATYGGVQRPEIGDSLIATRRDETKVYCWNGEKRQADSASWTLVFEFVAPHRIGGNVRQ